MKRQPLHPDIVLRIVLRSVLLPSIEGLSLENLRRLALSENLVNKQKKLLRELPRTALDITFGLSRHYDMLCGSHDDRDDPWAEARQYKLHLTEAVYHLAFLCHNPPQFADAIHRTWILPLTSLSQSPHKCTSACYAANIKEAWDTLCRQHILVRQPGYVTTAREHLRDCSRCRGNMVNFLWDRITQDVYTITQLTR